MGAQQLVRILRSGRAITLNNEAARFFTELNAESIRICPVDTNQLRTGDCVLFSSEGWWRMGYIYVHKCDKRSFCIVCDTMYKHIPARDICGIVSNIQLAIPGQLDT